MDYISSKKLSENWGISTKRITVLAGEGRIPGAKQINGRWIFPADAEKPEDSRTKESKISSKNRGKFFLPYIISSIYSNEQLDGFSDEEKEVYKIGMLYEDGCFKEVKNSSIILLKNTSNKYVKLALLYLLPMTCLMLREYKEMEDYTLLFKLQCDEIDDHKNIIDYISKEFDSEMLSVVHLTDNDIYFDALDCEDEIMPSVIAGKLFSELYKLLTEENYEPDIVPYEINLRMIEYQGYFFCSMLMHIYLGTYYGFKDDKINELKHYKMAVKTAIDNDCYFTLSYLIQYNTESIKKVFSEYPPEVYAKFKGMSDLYNEAHNDCREYLKNSNILPFMNEDDLTMITCCIKHYSTEKIAYVFDMSESGVKKRLSVLYKKLGVKSRNELVKKYVKYIMELQNS